MCSHVVPLLPDALHVVNVITGPKAVTIAYHPRPTATRRAQASDGRRSDAQIDENAVQAIQRVSQRQAPSHVATPPAAFGALLWRDRDAWSTSPLGDQISRLEMRKRTRYGRASFDLLRQCLGPGMTPTSLRCVERQR